MDTKTIKKGIKIAFVVYACSAMKVVSSVNVSMPTKADVHLFRVLAPKFVGLIPNSLIAKDKSEDVAQERKNQVKQFIVAGSDLFDLALDIESGEFTDTLKKKLNAALEEFNKSTQALSKKATELKTVTKKLVNAKGEQRLQVIEEQMALSLDMLDTLTGPLSTASHVFQDLQRDLLSKLLNMIEVIPGVKEYLSVGQGTSKQSLNQFIWTKIREMVVYTKNQQMIATNLKRYMQDIKTLHDTCKKELMEYKEQVKVALETKQSPVVQERPIQPVKKERILPQVNKYDEKKEEPTSYEDVELYQEEEPQDSTPEYQQEEAVQDTTSDDEEQERRRDYIYERGQALERMAQEQEAPMPEYSEFDWQ